MSEELRERFHEETLPVERGVVVGRIHLLDRLYREGWHLLWEGPNDTNTQRIFKFWKIVEVNSSPDVSVLRVEESCHCAATRAPCAWCTSPDRVEEDFRP